MFKHTKLCSGLLLAFGGLAIAPGSAMAQDAATLQRVEVTGSAIKRASGETALPVQVISRKDIDQSGASNAQELLQRLPVMGNSTTETSGVGNETYGFSGVSIHDIGETRTLVLLNGRRIAKSGGQAVTGALNGVDLNTLPITAIDRLEILTDGASALYGADAVAGVVNIITRHSATEFALTAGASAPKGGVAKEQRISLTKGFGNYDTDGYNFTFSLSADKRDNLQATDREFSKTGIVSGADENGRVIGVAPNNGTSKRAMPANVNFYDPTDGSQVARINPALQDNGACPQFTIKSGKSCRFDYTSQLEIYPERDRQNAYASLDLNLGQGTKLFGELLLGKTKSTARIAPPPGELAIQPGTVAWNHAIAIATKAGLVQGVDYDPTTIDANLRFSELGKRTNINQQELIHAVAGLEGTLAGWDYTTSLIHSQNTAKDTFGGGYASVSGVASATLRGFDPFLPLGAQSAAGNAALQASKIDGYWNGGLTTFDALNVQASKEIGKLDGGAIGLAVGATLNKEKLDARTGEILGGRTTYAVDASGQPCAATGKPCVGTGIDQRFGDTGIQPAYSANRDTLGLFTEANFPISKQLEFTTSLRWDKTNDFGSTTNGKVAMRFQPTKEVLIRGSLGTGYIAPSLAQINAPKQNFGVTSASYDCSGTPAADALQKIANGLGVTCDDGSQFNVYAVGTPNLQPEKTKQATLGVFWEASSNLAVSADLWTVQINDTIGTINEAVVFADPGNPKYARYFTDFKDPSTGKRLLAFITPNENQGTSITTGLDLGINSRFKVAGGKWNSNANITYFLRADAQQQKDGPYLSSINNADETGVVTFKWKGSWVNSFEIDNWTHTLATNFKSGYMDGKASPSILSGPDKGTSDAVYRISVPNFVTFDWQTTYVPFKSLSLTAGVINLFDREPPFTLATGGSNRGQETGWDGRYFDPRGRTVYLNATYKF